MCVCVRACRRPIITAPPSYNGMVFEPSETYGFLYKIYWISKECIYFHVGIKYFCARGYLTARARLMTHPGCPILELQKRWKSIDAQWFWHIAFSSPHGDGVRRRKFIDVCRIYRTSLENQRFCSPDVIWLPVCASSIHSCSSSLIYKSIEQTLITAMILIRKCNESQAFHQGDRWQPSTPCALCPWQLTSLTCGWETIQMMCVH